MYGYRSSLFDGILDDDAFRARMRALADRTRRLARDYRRRPLRRIRIQGAPPDPGPYGRPVIVRVVYYDRTKGAYPHMVAALANYMTKDGPLFDRDRDQVDKRAIVDAWSHDRRIYHVIVCPNDGHRIDDMTGYGRALLTTWEQRVGRLEWVASAEEKPDRAHPGGNKHLHVMIRAVRDERDLVFARDVVTNWLRLEAVEVTTDLLGYMDERERRALVEQRVRMFELRRDLERGIDRGLGGRAL